jgi:hypothetical protein
MKKAIALILAVLVAFTMLFAFVGCSGETDADETTTLKAEIKLVKKSAYGLSMTLPEEFADFTEKTEGTKVTSFNGASVVVTDLVDASDIPLDSWTEEDYLTEGLANTVEPKILEFKKDAKVSGYDALFVHYSVKDASGNSFEGYNYAIYYPLEDGKTAYQSITFTTVSTGETSLKANIDAVLASLTVEE